MSTVREVARRAGVSIATVSRVLNKNASVTEEIRQRVLAAINECRYVPTVSRRNTQTLGLIYAGPWTLGSPYDVSLLEGMGQAMGATDLDLMILNPHRDKPADESYTQYFLRKGVRGAILRMTADVRDVCRQITDERFPAVAVGDHFDDPNIAFVYADSRPASRQAMEHLISLGHRRIALAANEHADGDHGDRLAAYHETLAEHEIPVDEKLIFKVPARRPDGAQVLRSMMTHAQPPTAIFVADPLVAIGLINEARNSGMSIPDDLSVVGFDDRDARKDVLPCMTAVCQDAVELGRKAFLELARVINSERNDEAPKSQVAATWFEINQSTGAPPSAPTRILPDGTRLELPAVEAGPAAGTAIPSA